MNVLVIADQGVDTNLISSKILANIQKHDTKLVVRDLGPPHTYRNVSGDICVTFETTVTLDVYLKVRNGTNLISRNISCELSKNAVDMAIIQSRVPESNVCDN